MVNSVAVKSQNSLQLMHPQLDTAFHFISHCG